MRLAIFVTASLALLGSSAWAMSDDEMTTAMAEHLEKQIYVNPQAFTVFNYSASRGETDGWAKFNEGIHYFWAPEQREGEHSLLGGGIYTAVDPLISRRYGGANFDLLMIEVPAGARILKSKVIDQENYVLLEYPHEIERELRDRRCSVSFYERIRGFLNPLCRFYELAAFKKLGVDAIDYRWEAQALDGCSGRIQRAFVITGALSFWPERVKLMKQTAVEGDEDEMQIEALARQHGRSIWPKLAPSADDQKSRAWRSKHLLNCRKS